MAADRDSSGISFTALYTSATWQRYGLSVSGLTPPSGQALYQAMRPIEAISRIVAGGNLQTFLLQRHLIIDQLIANAVENQGITHILEIACGLSPRGIRLRQRFPHLHVIESDLPAMASRKAAFLAAGGYLGDRHQVRPMDIFATDDPLSPEVFFREELAPEERVLVITEGLTSYFPLTRITEFWQRLANALAARPGSAYLTETYLLPASRPLRQTLNLGARILGGMTNAEVSFHFEDGESAVQHLQAQGFTSVTAHNPVDFYGALPIPESRGDPLIRVVEARI